MKRSRMQLHDGEAKRSRTPGIWNGKASERVSAIRDSLVGGDINCIRLSRNPSSNV